MTEPPPGQVTGLVERILHFIDKPWKAVTVVVLMILCAVGWFLYIERTRIADILLRSSPEPELDIPRFAGDVQRLLRITQGDAALLMDINLIDNLLRARAGFDRDGNPWLPLQGQQLALYPDTPMPILFKLLRNEVVCGDISADSTLEEWKAEAALGMKRVCIVAVPPMLHVMAGILAVSWREPLDAAGETKAGIVMTSAAMNYANW